MGHKVGRLSLKYGKLFLDAWIYAVGIGWFLEPNRLAPGGVSGVSILLEAVLGLPAGLWILLLNIPILIFGILEFGWKFMISTAYSVLMSSAALLVLESGGITALTSDPLLAALAGGSLVALGLGLTFRHGSTTGGTDILIRYLRKKIPHLKTGSLMLWLDAGVVAASAFVYRDPERALYAGVSVLVISKVLDLVLYGGDGARLLYIISDRPLVIAGRMLRELEVGITYIEGKGAYTTQTKKIIFCAIRKNLYPKAEKIVKEEDPRAFLIVSGASEIYGEGYKSYFSEKI